MKQRSDLAEETDSLLRACWALAEMLFSLRQNRRDGKVPDEELLGSAVQACWELCDIFREGWTQVRPDRGTPRPNQVNFFAAGPQFGSRNSLDRSSHQSDISRSNAGSRASIHSKRESLRSLADLEARQPRSRGPVPETPVTEFEDTPISPDASPQMPPNILVLGTDSRSDRGGRWSSNASNLSGYSQNTSSTSKTATNTIEDINITRVKALLVKAAMNIGFSREAAGGDGTGGAASLQAFVKSLPPTSFGPASNGLLQNYKNLILVDSNFRSPATLPARGRRFSTIDVAKSVGWMMMRSREYNFLRDLFRLVFGVQLEDADTRKNASIVV